MMDVVDHPVQTQAFTGEQSSKIISIKGAMIYILIPAVAVLTVISFTIIIKVLLRKTVGFAREHTMQNIYSRL